MKFICLHGSLCNAKVFRVQLDPFCRELEADGTASFHFTQGKVETKLPSGFEEYFGPGPHYKFFDDAGIADKSLTERIQDMPQRDTHEETIRALARGGWEDGQLDDMDWSVFPSHKNAFAPLYDEIDNDDEIEGIIGYSEGSVVAASLILDEQRRFEQTGRPKRIKCALFFAGWPAVGDDGQVVLADESEEMCEVPSIHVIGAADPYIAGSMALYNTFDEDCATLFDHGKGHTLPRDPRTLKELANTVRSMISNVRSYDSGNSSDTWSVSEESD